MSLNNPIHPPLQSSSPTEIPRTISSSQLDGPHTRGEATELVPSPHGDPPAAEAQDGTPQQPAFQPFFTLIEDIPAGEYHHPTVHYIFSDDDTDIITEAALRSLEAQQDALPANKKHAYIGQHDETEGREPSTLLPPPIPGVQEKYVVLDVEPVPASEHTSPRSSASNHKLQRRNHQYPVHIPSNTTAPQYWQVMRSEMVPAPTFENNEDGDGTGHGLMLKIHGTAGLPYAAESGKEHGTPRLEDMMNQFAKRMAELQTVIDSAHVEENVETEEPHSGDGEPGAVADQEQAQELPHKKNMSADEQAQDGEVPEQKLALDEVEG
ncbi:hypothetical protein N7451_001644 [Penicillium sp. IBT 35674x]|nr:hypothetical protein N7451_001644 [Penicillium sp. IBT 35674x]